MISIERELMVVKKTKIICTLGPATDHKEILVDLIRSGMDVARFNFSHGTHEECAGRISLLKEAVKETGRTIGFMGDTKGPEMRLGIFKNGKIVLKPGQSFVLTTENIEGTEERSYVNYSELPKDIHEGDMILLNDGKQSLKVDRLTDTEIFTTVVSGGEVSSRKRVAVPGAILKLPFMSEADVSDITFAAEQGMDYLAASFVRNADDVMQIKRLLEKLHSSMGIIAKIENRSGVQNVREISEVVDGIMIARGDLGVEIPYMEVPSVQKEIVQKCRLLGKRVIIATEMLESMITNIRPTRAEISDVANAVYDGASAIMLSGESAAGKYPVEAVKTMSEVAEFTEQRINYQKRFKNTEFITKNNLDAISHATCQMAIDVSAKCIVVSSQSGLTARMVSRFRCPTQIIGMTTSEKVYRKLALSWGVIPILCEQFDSIDVLFYHAIQQAQKILKLKDGDNVVLTGGQIGGKRGNTNTIKVETIHSRQHCR